MKTKPELEGKELPENVISNTKRAYFILSTSGKEGKSTNSCLIADAFERRGIPLAKLDADKDHRSFIKAYGQKDEFGDLLPKDEQDPVKGCKLIDLNTEHSEIPRLVGANTNHMIVDFRAAGIDEVPLIFGSMSKFTLFLKKHNFVGTYIIPICSDKSFQSIYAVYDLLNEVENPSMKFEIVLVRSKGLMHINETTKKVEELFATDPIIKLISKNDKFVLKQLETSAQLTPRLMELIKVGTIAEAAEKVKFDPFDDFMMDDFIRDGDELFNLIK